jgi:hypothetical protein
MYVAAGTTYWIVVAAQDNPGGLLTLHAGDTAALGFIKPGMKGAAGLSVHQWNYAANGIDAAGFLTFLHPSGGHVLRIGMEARGSCAVGYDWITYLQGLLVTGAFQPYPGIVYPPEHFVGYGPAFIPPYHTSGDCGVGGTFHGNIERSTGATSGVVSEELYFYGQIHVRFRCGDWDEISHDILPTGYVEVKWENSDIGFEQGTGDVFRFENVALGGPSYTRPPFGPSYPPSSWEGVMWHPSQYTDRFYVRDIDEFNLTWDPSAAGLLYFKDWTATPATPADMYVEDGGVWERWYHSSVDEDEQAPSQKAIPMIDPQGRPANVDNTTNISYAFFAFRTPVEGLPPYIPPSSNSCPVDFPIEAEPAGGSCAPPFFDPDTEENWP